MPVKVTGVSFDGAHSYNDWGLKLKSVSIGVPKAKTVYVSVNGMNGSLDLTEAQNGGVVYEMRTLKFTFDARHPLDWTNQQNCESDRGEGKADHPGCRFRLLLYRTVSY